MYRSGWTTGIVYLIEDHPVGVNLRVSLWVQHHGLIGPEVGQGDLGVLWAVVDHVYDTVFVKVSFARVSNLVSWNRRIPLRNHRAENTHMCSPLPHGTILTVCILLVQVGNQSAVVIIVQDAVVIVIVITFISLSKCKVCEHTPIYMSAHMRLI